MNKKKKKLLIYKKGKNLLEGEKEEEGKEKGQDMILEFPFIQGIFMQSRGQELLIKSWMEAP